MKKVVLILSAAVFTTVIYSCKNENLTTTDLDTPETEVNETSEDLALVNTNETTTETEAEFLYVTAPSGLSLREYGNLQSEKLARMPYGTKVKVINSEKSFTMNGRRN